MDYLDEVIGLIRKLKNQQLVQHKFNGSTDLFYMENVLGECAINSLLNRGVQLLDGSSCRIPVKSLGSVPGLQKISEISDEFYDRSGKRPNLIFCSRSFMGHLFDDCGMPRFNENDVLVPYVTMLDGKRVVLLDIPAMTNRFILMNSSYVSCEFLCWQGEDFLSWGWKCRDARCVLDVMWEGDLNG